MNHEERRIWEDYFRNNKAAVSTVSEIIFSRPKPPKISKVIFNDPATIVYWSDNVKTVVRCQPGDTFDKEIGLMAAMLKRYMGNDNTYNKELAKWLYDDVKDRT